MEYKRSFQIDKSSRSCLDLFTVILRSVWCNQKVLLFIHPSIAIVLIMVDGAKLASLISLPNNLFVYVQLRPFIG